MPTSMTASHTTVPRVPTSRMDTSRSPVSQKPLLRTTAPCTAASHTTISKNKGRPSKIGSTAIETKDIIIAVASDLFRERGYAKTSLAEIARRLEINPSSLYYWFPSKEAILECLFNVHDLEPFLTYTNSIRLSATNRLYSLIVNDVIRKCELPFDFFELESLAHENPERFESLFEGYRAMFQAMANTIRQGITQGEFIACDADEKVVTILSINEGLQHHYHAKERNELILESSGYVVRGHSPLDIGHMAASSVIPALVTQPVDMNVVLNESTKAMRAFMATAGHTSSAAEFSASS